MIRKHYKITIKEIGVDKPVAVSYTHLDVYKRQELIIFNPKTQVGSEDGFIPEGTYYSMARNGQLIVLRRGIPGCPALVDFETMRKDVKKEYIVRKGDPRAEIAAKTQKSILEDAIVYSNAAYEFFSVKSVSYTHLSSFSTTLKEV